MKNKKFITLLIFISILSFSTQSQALNQIEIPYEPLNEEELKNTILLGHEWLLKAQEPGGHFKYEYIPYLDRYSDDDNIVRQMGVLYILGEIAVRDEFVNEDTREALLKSIDYVKSQSRKGNFKGYNFKCVNYTSKNNCQLGGTSLALLGILNFVEAYPEYSNEFNKLIEDYKNFILAMSKEGKGFRNMFYFDKSQNKYESAFSNGEALLALVRYYKYNSEEKIKDIIDEKFDYYYEWFYENEERDSGFYLWGMAAVKDLYEIEAEQKYIDFVKDFTDEKIYKKQSRRFINRNTCGYIEGVVSAYSVLEENVNAGEKDKYLEEINYWLWKNKRLQLLGGDRLLIRFSDERPYALKPKGNNAFGGFLTAMDEPVQRIDFTQHCISSYIQKHVDIDRNNLNTLN